CWTNDEDGIVRCLGTGSRRWITMLASDQSGPGGIAVDSTNAYWTNYTGITAYPIGGSAPQPGPNQGTLWRAPIDGGTATVLATGYEFGGVAIDATHAYWSDVSLGTVNAVPLAGGTPTVLATYVSVVAGPVVDDDSVYWITIEGVINRVAKPR
ncbi:MAG: hypothetical protein ACRENE_19385, partial [Polyangiaceae bacterium]